MIDARNPSCVPPMSPPQYTAVARRIRVTGARHQREVVAAIFSSDFVGGLDVHQRIGIAVLANAPAVEHLVGTALGNVFLRAIELEAGDAELEQFGHAVLPIFFRLRDS